MGETPHKQSDADVQKEDASEEASWREDQKNRGYYYDDSHGYETYVPELDDDIDEDDNPDSDKGAGSTHDQLS